MTKWKWLGLLFAILFSLMVLFLFEILVPLMSGDFPPCQDGTWDRERQTCVPDPNWSGG